MMKHTRILIFALLVLSLLLSAEIGFTLQNALDHFDYIQPHGYRTVINTETGCYLKPWTTYNPDGSVFFSGSEGAAVNALLFMCGP